MDTNEIHPPIEPSLKKGKMKKQKIKKRTLDEFKHWLEGLYEFQDSDWIPNREQWEYIKDSIYAIKEEPKKIIEQQAHHTQIPVQYKQNIPINPNVIPPNSGLDAPNQSNRPIVDMRNHNSLTKDIDTSDGHYTSEFE